MTGSKRETRRSWLRGRGRNSLRGETKFSLKKNKKMLNRRVRHCTDTFQGCEYKKLARAAAWDYVT